MKKKREGESSSGGGRSSGNQKDGANSLSPDVVRPREVEITVYDKQLDEVRVFRCDLHLLASSMAYFVPIINRYLEEEEVEVERTANAGAAAAAGGGGEGGKMASYKKNSTSVKGQRESDTSRRNRVHSLPPIPLRVNCEMSIFSWLMSYIEGKQHPFTPENVVSIALSSNFLLMTQLVDLPLQYIKDHLVEVMLSGVNMECLTGELLARLSGMLSEGDLACAFLELFEWSTEEFLSRRFLTALLRHLVCDRFGEGRVSGLHWCRYCGILFDQQELERLERSEKNAKPAVCPRLSENSIGARGESLKTHVASHNPVELVAPSLYCSDEEVERWAWRVIGATYFFLCRHCCRHVLLIETITHECPNGMENFCCVEEGSSCVGAEALLAWYATAKDLYVGGLSPIYNHQTAVSRECVMRFSSTGEWTCDDGSERGIPGLWSTHPTAVEESVDAKGRVNLDAQNRFERWLVEELQQMMEEFSEMSRPATVLDGVHGAKKTPLAAAAASTIPTTDLTLTPLLSSSSSSPLPPPLLSSHWGGNVGEHFTATACERSYFRDNTGGRLGVHMRPVTGGNYPTDRRRDAMASSDVQRPRMPSEHMKTEDTLPAPNSVRAQHSQVSRLRTRASAPRKAGAS